jgi:hypothetical protein
MAAMLADDTLMDDRRRIVGAGVRRGRDAAIAGMRPIAELGVTNITSVAIATRGTRLALCRTRAGKIGPEAFDVEALQIVEIDAYERMAALVSFGLDDIDAAFEELDARYLAGEAVAHANTWVVISQAYAGLNRREFVATTPDWVNTDRRRLATIEAGRLADYIRASRDATPDVRIHIEAVHRLSSLGAVVSRAVNGTSQDGFYAEWREVDLLTLEGNSLSRCEIFDDVDVDVALARFDELNRPAP